MARASSPAWPTTVHHLHCICAPPQGAIQGVQVHLRRLDELSSLHRRVVASVAVQAPRAVIWEALTRYADLPGLIPSLESSEVLPCRPGSPPGLLRLRQVGFDGARASSASPSGLGLTLWQDVGAGPFCLAQACDALPGPGAPRHVGSAPLKSGFAPPAALVRFAASESGIFRSRRRQ